MSFGKTIKLFLADGTPGGLMTAEILNWTGHVVMAPRSSLSELIKRPEMNRTGIYFLVGDDPESFGGTLSYIGEADDISRRLYQHARSEEQGGKDFWDRVIAVTSKDFNLTKAHARWLESKLIALATESKRTKLTNGTSPQPVQLPEADISDMEFFTEQIKLILPVLGENLLRSAGHQRSNAQIGANAIESDSSPIFKLSQLNTDLYATAQEVDGEFTVMAGSTARNTWIGSHHGYRPLYEQLISSGILVPDDSKTHFVFANDQVFSAPSAAAAVVLGRQANGRTEWKDQSTGMSYGAWQEKRLTEEVAASQDSGETPV